ncbi:YczE/YyaS/YitT family protein [Brevibacillus fulvus]|uniref:Membrane protein YczE n=1 Tax=Brevibacillus fulvus TaxID=1125967 RepID=A0A938XQY0_9BACL|nr:YitT family protein [Brevibacillus fulvus]MBM7588518.1 putative membrane protein YczE [Brevibacillus fulvus]
MGKINRPLCVRFLMFTLGIAIMALGSVMTVRANLGVAPWDTLNIGLYRTFGLTIGVWSQVVGLFVIVTSYAVARLKPGIGTWLNMLLFGLFFDFFTYLDLIPEYQAMWQRMILLLAGLLVISIGIGMYISPRVGAGPRDSFMLALHEKTGWSIQKVRLMIEVLVLAVGWLMGGPVSIGTLIIAGLTGPLIQRTIPFWEKLMKRQYQPQQQKHSIPAQISH